MKTIIVLVALVVGTYANPTEKRNADQTKTWLNGKIPYVIDSSVDARVQGLLSAAMQEVQHKTCVNFAKTSGGFHYVRFKQSANKECSAPVGRYGGEQVVILGTDCQSQEGILYFLVTTMGFYPEHTRADRDQFVTVNLKNVDAGKHALFNKQHYKTFGLAYDYASIMHWAADKFSSNGGNTLVPKDGNTQKIGVAKSLSVGDVKKIDTLHGCAVTATSSPHCCDTKTDCAQLGSQFCASAGQFARDRCPRTCGACFGSCPNPVKDPCKDEIPDCHEFQRDICFHKDYVYFANKNCKKWCNLC